MMGNASIVNKLFWYLLEHRYSYRYRVFRHHFYNSEYMYKKTLNNTHFKTDEILIINKVGVYFAPISISTVKITIPEFFHLLHDTAF